MKIAALTHVRKDDFYLEKWVNHYGKLAGRENCHVLLDGADWQPAVDLDGVVVEVVGGRTGLRVKDDIRLAEAQNRVIDGLFQRGYDYVIRGDCDELVCVDPAQGRSLEEALSDAAELGYIYSSGVDVLHDVDNEPPIDPARPFLAQRRLALINKFYFKVNVLSRSTSVGGGGHRADGPVRVSDTLYMFHLANADLGVFRDRAAARQDDARGGSYDAHIAHRQSAFDLLKLGVAPLEFDATMHEARRQFQTRGKRETVYRPQKFRSGNAVLDGRNVFIVRIDDRFADLL